MGSDRYIEHAESCDKCMYRQDLIDMFNEIREKCIIESKIKDGKIHLTNSCYRCDVIADVINLLEEEQIVCCDSDIPCIELDEYY